MTPQVQELSRKLAWAVNTALDVQEAALRRRVATWAYRLATKLVAAKRQFSLTNELPPPDNGMAGGGGAAGSTGAKAPLRSPTPNPNRGAHASHTVESNPVVRVGNSGQNGRRGDCASSRCGCSRGRRSGTCSVRRSASDNDWWRWVCSGSGGYGSSQETPPGSNGR